MLGLSVNIKNETLFVRLRGELDERNSEALRSKLSEFIKKYNVKNVCFNLARITFIDSSGIGVILGRYKEVMNKGEVFICEAKGEIKKIIKMSGIEQIIRIKETEENVRCLLKMM